jgi:hypothetical protein
MDMEYVYVSTVSVSFHDGTVAYMHIGFTSTHKSHQNSSPGTFTPGDANRTALKSARGASHDGGVQTGPSANAFLRLSC